MFEESFNRFEVAIKEAQDAQNREKEFFYMGLALFAKGMKELNDTVENMSSDIKRIRSRLEEVEDKIS